MPRRRRDSIGALTGCAGRAQVPTVRPAVQTGFPCGTGPRVSMQWGRSRLLKRRIFGLASTGSPDPAETAIAAVVALDLFDGEIETSRAVAAGQRRSGARQSRDADRTPDQRPACARAQVLAILHRGAGRVPASRIARPKRRKPTACRSVSASARNHLFSFRRWPRR